MVWDQLQAIRKFKNLVDFIGDEGLFRTSDSIGKRLEQRFLDMQSSLYNENDLMSTLVYSLNRFPPGFETFKKIKLIGHGDSLEGAERITSLARRYPAYVSPEGELLIYPRAEKYDLYDILSRLQSVICASREITKPLRNPLRRRRLRRTLGMDIETQMRTLSGLTDISYEKLIETDGKLAKELRGGLPRMLLTLADRNYGRFGFGSFDMEFEITSGFREGSKSRSERRWAENIRNVINEAGYNGRPLIVFSANLFTTLGVLSPYPRIKETIPVYEDGPDGQLPTAFETKPIIGIPPSVHRTEWLYRFYAELQEHLADERNREEYAKANEHFMIPIPDRNEPGTGVDCQLFDLGAIDWNMTDPYLHPDLDFIENEQPLLLVMDYPFGETQAYNLITYLSFMARPIVAFGAIGKAAGFSGMVGDVIIPNFFRKAQQKTTCDAHNIIEPDDGMSRFFGLNIERGTLSDGCGVGMSTLDGTFLGNQESYEYYLKQLQCPGGDMEGTGLAMGIQSMVLTGRIANVPRAFAYYTSDVPTRAGEGLTSGSMSKEYGTRAVYGCTLTVLHHLLNPAAWNEVKYFMD
ncbi:MAG: hypothetical protein ABIH90_00985 [Candidatus Aenigmatarchaeota archaeon]